MTDLAESDFIKTDKVFLNGKFTVTTSGFVCISLN